MREEQPEPEVAEGAQSKRSSNGRPQLELDSDGMRSLQTRDARPGASVLKPRAAEQPDAVGFGKPADGELAAYLVLGAVYGLSHSGALDGVVGRTACRCASGEPGRAAPAGRACQRLRAR